LVRSSTDIERKLDFEEYGYGEVKTSSANFLLNNVSGQFNAHGTLYSLFDKTLSRHHTKIRYNAGYLNSNGDQIDETVFQGLINEKSLNESFYDSGTISFVAQGYEQILNEQSIISGSLLPEMTANQVISRIMSNYEVLRFVGFSPSKINISRDITFQNATAFENRKITDVLTDICKKTNSIWYIDEDLELVIRRREPNDNTPHIFLGGEVQSIDVNIVSIDSYDSGYTNIINDIVYDSDDIKYSIRPDIDSTIRNGVQTYNLSGKDLTDRDTIFEISEAIISEFKTPKIRIQLRTVFSPNIYNFFDKCRVDYRAGIKSIYNKPLLIINQGDKLNDGKYFGVLKNQVRVLGTKTFLYYGYKHTPGEGTTTHYLMEA
jgi:hypothetical protein